MNPQRDLQMGNPWVLPHPSPRVEGADVVCSPLGVSRRVVLWGRDGVPLPCLGHATWAREGVLGKYPLQQRWRRPGEVF